MPRREQNLRLLPEVPLNKYHVDGVSANYSVIKHAGREVGRINVLPATVGLTMDVESRDLRGNIVARENWDWRGFKSSQDHFHPDGSVASRTYFNRQGRPVLEEVWMNVNGQLAPSMWELLNYRGHNYRFNTEDQLFLFFLNELISKDDQAILISDRHTLDYVVADVQGAKAKWGYLHGVHTDKPATPGRGHILNVYRTLLQDRADAFDGVFVATPEQQHELQQRFPDMTVRVAPDTTVPTTYDHQAGAQPTVIFVGRFGPDKRPEQAIQMMAQVVQRVPNAQLHLYGYAPDDATLANLNRQINKLGLKDHVIVGAYLSQRDLAHVYATADVIVQTSSSESFGMNLVEAMSYGVPVVTYNVPYGAANLVRNGDNGYVVPDNATKQMAAKVSKLLTDKRDWSAKSAAALAWAREFTYGRDDQVVEGITPINGRWNITQSVASAN
ncbi:glycosyltransferase [Lacticaseibacillus thailandensis]|uniref:glycosyltransferase n=1 Tax=Lacticaseibacillus thailandensis TaxID=381741 RepID=UPI000A64CA0D|nr:glycosyltransferase [Lacticaseibacillus thailandensis]